MLWSRVTSRLGINFRALRGGRFFYGLLDEQSGICRAKMFHIGVKALGRSRKRRGWVI